MWWVWRNGIHQKPFQGETCIYLEEIFWCKEGLLRILGSRDGHRIAPCNKRKRTSKCVWGWSGEGRRWSWQSWVVWWEGREGRPSRAEKQTVLEKMWGMWYKLPSPSPLQSQQLLIVPCVYLWTAPLGQLQTGDGSCTQGDICKAEHRNKEHYSSIWLCESKPSVPGWTAHPISNCPKMLLLPSEICKACWAASCLLSILWQCLAGILTIAPAVVGSAELGQRLKCPYKLNYKYVKGFNNKYI